MPVEELRGRADRLRAAMGRTGLDVMLLYGSGLNECGHPTYLSNYIVKLPFSALVVLPREGERLWTLNAVRVPDGVDEAAVRMYLLDAFNIEIGAGLGPLAGKIWRVGLMGASSSPRLIVLLRGALESALAKQGQRV